ncbi:hypothetical protein [Paenibacillus sp. FSL R10-2736]|uniref:hypothetical protein n=1 Tax=Paenibacillus sp. FSL R10-2736 TaxID=2954692 RepID=UPI0030F78133
MQCDVKMDSQLLCAAVGVLQDDPAAISAGLANPLRGINRVAVKRSGLEAPYWAEL